MSAFGDPAAARRGGFLRETIGEKADRLLAAGRVEIVWRSDQRLMARVRGDHGTYMVVATAFAPMRCGCPAGEHGMRCSHLIAVELVTMDGALPTARDRVNP